MHGNKPSINRMISKKDALHVLDIIHASLSCTNPLEFRKLIYFLKKVLPFDYAVATMAFMPGRCDSASSYELINISYPWPWLDKYLMNKYYLVDPIVKENFGKYGLQYWGDTFSKYRPPKEFIEESGGFDLRNGYSTGQSNIGSTEGSLFSFAGNEVERSLRMEVILDRVTPHLHQALKRALTSEQERTGISLTDREKEVLRWIKEGKTTWDVSMILHISQDTVKFHLKNVFRKLNATSRSHAVAIALDHKLIDF